MKNIYILHKRISDKYLLIYSKFSNVEKYKVIYYTEVRERYNNLATIEDNKHKSNEFLSYIYKLFR